jgi:hypothetical protein
VTGSLVTGQREKSSLGKMYSFCRCDEKNRRFVSLSKKSPHLGSFSGGLNFLILTF